MTKLRESLIQLIVYWIIVSMVFIPVWVFILVDDTIIVDSQLNQSNVSVTIQLNRNTDWFGDSKLENEFKKEIYNITYKNDNSIEKIEEEIKTKLNKKIKIDKLQENLFIEEIIILPGN